jgi:transposase-like protein
MASAGAFRSSNPIFHNQDAARLALEKLRWPDGPVCPKSSCGAGVGPDVAKLAHRDGLYRCRTCRGQFTVTVGTVFASSKVPLSKWLQAAHLISSNKRKADVPIRLVEAELDVTYKTAWHMVHKMLGASTAYTGPNTVFGEKVKKHISAVRPKAPKVKLGNFTPWYIWRRKHPLGERIVSAGLLSSFALAEAPAENLDLTECLLRLLIAGAPKLSKSAKRKAAKLSRKLSRLKRGMVPAVTPQL